MIAHTLRCGRTGESHTVIACDACAKDMPPVDGYRVTASPVDDDVDCEFCVAAELHRFTKEYDEKTRSAVLQDPPKRFSTEHLRKVATRLAALRRIGSDCESCDSHGVMERGTEGRLVHCRRCEGTGRVVGCRRCHGTGKRMADWGRLVECALCDGFGVHAPVGESWRLRTYLENRREVWRARRARAAQAETVRP